MAVKPTSGSRIVFVGTSQGVNLNGKSSANCAFPSERKPLPRVVTFNSVFVGFKFGTSLFRSKASPLTCKTWVVDCFALSRTALVEALPSVVQLPSRFNFVAVAFGLLEAPAQLVFQSS